MLFFAAGAPRSRPEGPGAGGTLIRGVDRWSATRVTVADPASIALHLPAAARAPLRGLLASSAVDPVERDPGPGSRSAFAEP